jgi:hypothetical protein
MRVKIAFCLLLAALFLLPSCAPKPVASDQAVPGGSWTGEYQVSPERRESIGVDLKWEGGTLRGVVRAGVRSLPLTKASFQADTGAISLEFDAEGNGGRTVHYVIDGKVSGNTMTGTWTHDDQRGEFRVTKQ